MKKDFKKWLTNPWQLKPLHLLIPLIVLVLAGIGFWLWLSNPSPYSKSQPYYALESSSITSYSARSMPLTSDLAFGEQSSNNGNLGIDRKIIYTGLLDLEVVSADEASQFTLEYLHNKGGFVAETQRTIETDGRIKIKMVLRLPSPSFDDCLSDLATLGKILDQNIQGQDITEEYYDLAARLDSKTQQERRYLEILRTAVSVEEVLQVERELERIRTEIESMEGRMRYFQDRTDLATITLNFKEPAKKDVKVSALSIFAEDILNSFLTSASSIVLLISFILPWILVAGIIIAIIRFFKKRRS